MQSLVNWISTIWGSLTIALRWISNGFKSLGSFIKAIPVIGSILNNMNLCIPYFCTAFVAVGVVLTVVGWFFNRKSDA